MAEPELWVKCRMSEDHWEAQDHDCSHICDDDTWVVRVPDGAVERMALVRPIPYDPRLSLEDRAWQRIGVQWRDYMAMLLRAAVGEKP